MDKIELTPEQYIQAKFRLFDLLGYDVTHPTVRAFHESTARTKVVTAARRTTKSYSAAHDVMLDLTLPGRRVWVVGPNYSQAEKEFRYIHERLVLGREKLGLPKPRVCLTNARNGSLYIEWPNGSVLEGKTSERPEGLLGEAVDVVIYAEAGQIPRKIREKYVGPTLNTTNGREIVPTTPEEGAEWVFELAEAGEERTFDWLEAFHWDGTANPKYNWDEYNKAKEYYGEDHPVFREQYMGLWTFAGGRVYPDFQVESHVIEPFPIPDSWPRYRAIDFGHRDPFVCLWFAVGPKGEIYVYREYYKKEGVTKIHAQHIKEYTGDERIRQTFADASGKQLIEDLLYEGIVCEPANRDHHSGRMAVGNYMIATPDGPPPFGHDRIREKYPRLYFFNTLENTIRELKFYRWKEADALHREGAQEKTVGDDHACFHPDTIVWTTEGRKRIVDMVGTTGEVVSKDGNIRRYSNVMKTRSNAEIVEVSFEDGSSVKCTPDHRFLTESGWVEAQYLKESMCYNGVSQSILKEDASWKSLSSSQIHAKILEEPRIISAVITSNVTGLDSTGKCGSITTGIYRKDSMSTTPTRTDRITIPATSNFCRVGTTSATTPKGSRASRLRRLCEKRRSGMGVKKVWRGTTSITRTSKENFTKFASSLVNSAVASLNRLRRKAGFAQTTVNRHGDESLGLTTLTQPADIAGSNTARIGMSENYAVPGDVLVKCVSVEPAGSSDVYCMGVEEDSAFCVGSGIVAHNCDCLRYLIVNRPNPFHSIVKTRSGSFNWELNQIRSRKMNGF